MPPLRFVFFLATAALLCLTAYTVLVRPPPLGWAVAALFAYAALILGGVFVLRWRVFVDAVVEGPPGSRGVALTFDDGPHPTWTPRILAHLRERKVTATFFVVGRKAEEYADLVRTILSEGHEVGLHSFAHDRMFALRSERVVRRDLERGVAVLEQICGRRPALFRPPIGHSNPTVARVIDDLDLVAVGWTVRGRDGVASARAEDVVRRVRPALRDGAIVLLHDSPERGDREPAAVRALPRILDAIEAERLEVVPLSKWIDASLGHGPAL
jgi:peptidoglycan/xylan/chitin deacetylase (PgdA/CDA1 family)